MRRPRIRRVLVIALLASAAAVVPILPAAAQPTTCPTTRDDLARVVVTTPEPSSIVSGRVEVRGRVEADSALFQVELFVGDSRKDVTYFVPPVLASDFTLAWDATRARAGAATVRVVACGGSSQGDSLISGTTSVEVGVEASSGPASTNMLVDAARPATSEKPSLTAGAMIAIPAAVCLLLAVGRRRQT